MRSNKKKFIKIEFKKINIRKLKDKILIIFINQIRQKSKRVNKTDTLEFFRVLFEQVIQRLVLSPENKRIYEKLKDFLEDFSLEEATR